MHDCVKGEEMEHWRWGQEGKGCGVELEEYSSSNYCYSWKELRWGRISRISKSN